MSQAEPRGLDDTCRLRWDGAAAVSDVLHDWAFLMPPLCLAAALAQFAMLPRLGAGPFVPLASLAAATATAFLASGSRNLWAAASAFKLSQLLGPEAHPSDSNAQAAEFAGQDAAGVGEAAVLVVVAAGLVQALLRAAAMAARATGAIASRMPTQLRPWKPDAGSTRPKGATR